jgi:hypothetical protein
VHRGAILSPNLYNIFTSDVSSSEFCGTATFAGDTVIFASGQTLLLVQDQLQDEILTKFLIIARIGKLKSTHQKRKRSTF